MIPTVCSPRGFYVLTGGIAMAAFLLRALPALVSPAHLGDAGYDDAVYFTSSALLIEGVLPYRDYFFAHPPGIALLLSPFALAGSGLDAWPDAFFSARVFAAAVGAANVVLVASLARRWRGCLAGVLAALLYASYTNAVNAESTVYLEPFVTALALLAVVVGRPEGDGRRRTFLAGLLIGCATAIKLWGGVYLIAYLVASSLSNWRTRGVALGSGFLTGFLIIVLPFAALAPGRFVDQVFGFQAQRPPDGLTGLGPRALELFGYGPVGVGSQPGLVGILALAVAAALVIWAVTSGDPLGRLFGAAVAITTSFFLATPAFFFHYAGFLAGSFSVLLAAGLATATRRLANRSRRAVLLVAALLLVLPTVSLVRSVNAQWSARDVDPLPPSVVSAVAASGCVTSDSPSLLLALNSIPVHPGVKPERVVVDLYGEQLQAARANGLHPRTSAEAFLTQPAQAVVRTQLDACSLVILVRPAEEQERWSAETKAWFAATFVRSVLSSRSGPEVWTAQGRR